MAHHLIDKKDRRIPDGMTVADLPTPPTGNKLYFDSEVKGFACRVTAGGARSFVLDYRAGQRQRRYTIGAYPDWKASAAREAAKALKKRIDLGEDPMGDRHEERAAPTVADLIDRFETDFLPKKAISTQRDYKAALEKLVRPTLGKKKVADVSHSDIDRLHRDVSNDNGPYRANRTVAVLSKAFALAIRWGWRDDNPVKGVEKNQEDRRARYLTGDELLHLSAALQEHRDQKSANAVRLLLLTGARRMEVLAATWAMFDLEHGVWIKPSAHTKQKKEHRVPLSAPARKLLIDMKELAEVKAKSEKAQPSAFVFPGKSKDDPHLTDIKRTWESLTQRATVKLWATKLDTPEGRMVKRLTTEKDGATTLPDYPDVVKVAEAEQVTLPAGLMDCRIHDLRHSYASMLASAGLSLPVIGALLGHTQPATTARYAHLFDDPLRAATERVGVLVEAAAGRSTSAEIHQMPKRG